MGERPRGATVYYGWRIVAVAFVTQCLTVGTLFYSFGVFFYPLAQDFGWSRAQISWGFSLAAVAGAVYAPLLGRLVDRLGPRPIQLFGAVVLGTAYLALATMQSLHEYYFWMGSLVALGSASLGPLPANAAVARWFVRKRGRALGISTAGISMGGVIFVPLTQWMIDAFGWRSAFVGLGVCVAAVGLPPIALWMRRSPEDLGLLPDGELAPRPSEDEIRAVTNEMERSLTPREAVRTANFWRIALSFGLTMGGLSAVLMHQTPYLIDQGVSPAAASWILGGTALIGVAGKLGFGSLIDAFDHRRVIAGCFVLQAIGLVLLYFASTPAVLVAYVLVYGWAMGGNATLQATILGECFGRLHYGAIAGRMSPIIVTLHATMVPLVGWVHDVTGSYTLAFGGILGTTLAAAAAISSLKRPPHGETLPAQAAAYSSR